MARKKRTVPTVEALQVQLAAMKMQLEKAQEQELKSRGMIEIQTAATAAVKTRLATQVQAQSPTPWSELMVGLRNISDNTIGVKGQFGNADLQLHADLDDDTPGQTAIVSYAWYRELRKGELFQHGYLIRDDSILGTAFTAAPTDEAHDLPAEWYINAVPDPQAWIDARDEQQILIDVEAMTSPESLQRLRRVVSEALVQLENTRPRLTREDQAAAAKWALSRLPAKLRTLDDVTSERIEERHLPQAPGDGRKIFIKR
jgi:hypothetical protein